MLSNIEKTNTLWKNYQGYGNTHNSRAAFEELYRAFNNISSESVLTYGNKIPRVAEDELFETVSHLDSTNPIAFYKESLYKNIPIVEKHFNVQCTPISSNCDHAFVILIDGKQVKNIIPFDYSDSGLYAYELKNYRGEEIPFGAMDWVLDTNSSLITFNNGVPEGIDATHPPIITFYQYVGPVGEKKYIEAALYGVENIPIPANTQIHNITQYAIDGLNNVEQDFYTKYKFNGSDLTPGIGLQYNLTTLVVNSKTKDPLKGYDDNSTSQVTSILSHKIGRIENVADIVFVSEGIPVGTYNIQVPEAERNETVKIDINEGFFVVKAAPGDYEIVVEETEELYNVFLVKDNETQNLELFYPREDLELTIQVPIFANLDTLPPHLKLTSMASISDHITPQYYGPRVADFVIASDGTSVTYRSADYVVYNNEKSKLQNAIDAIEGKHLFARNGEYLLGEETVIEGINVQGETRESTIFYGDPNFTNILYLKDGAVLQNVYLENVKVFAENGAVIKDSYIPELKVLSGNVVVKDSFIGTLTSHSSTEVFDSTIEDLFIKVEDVNSEDTITDESPAEESDEITDESPMEDNPVEENTQEPTTSNVKLFNTSVINILENNGELSAYTSYINNFINNEGKFYIQSSRIGTLDVYECDSNSVIDTSNINYVAHFPTTVKLDSSYVTQFSPAIERQIYPDDATMPFYTSFENRVYAKIPKPFEYNPEDNTLHLLLDTIEHTLFINENGELQCRFAQTFEMEFTSKNQIKTQIEKTYHQHADTLLDHERPDNVDEALLDLYWSKADLKGGKIPIDQLPDSIAGGGLSFVGMWSFEDHEGNYPTFADVDFAFMSDDEYTDLQRGWFFIVKASHKEDDPCYPQISIDGEEFTAGDWIVYGGRNKEAVVANVTTQPLNRLAAPKHDINTFLQYSETYGKTAVFSSCQQYRDRDKKYNDLSTIAFFEDKVDLYKSEGNFHFVESFPVEYIEGVFDKVLPEVTPYKTITQIKIDSYKFNVLGTAVRGDNTSYDNLDTQYITKDDYLNGTSGSVGRLILEAADEASKEWADTVFETIDGKFALRPTMVEGWWGENHLENTQPLDNWDLLYTRLVSWWGPASLETYEKWEKVDRAYLDPVYSRLPEYAPVKDGDNVEWWVGEGGTGLLRLKHETLAEALRLINESLLSLSPDRPLSIREMTPVIDVERSTAKKVDYIDVGPGQLIRYLEEDTKLGFIDGDVKVVLKGRRDYLPLENCFYSGLSSDVTAVDGTTGQEGTLIIDRFDPYARYKLGFRAPSGVDAAEAEADYHFALDENEYVKTHTVYFEQSNLNPTPQFLPEVSILEGRSSSIQIEEKKDYALEDIVVNHCLGSTVNLSELNAELNRNRMGGVGYLRCGTEVTGEFIINHFVKYGYITKDASVKVRAFFNEKELEVELTNLYLDIENEADGSYFLKVKFSTLLDISKENAEYGNLRVVAEVYGYGAQVLDNEVLLLEDLCVVNPMLKDNVVESGKALYPLRGSNVLDFGDAYINKAAPADAYELQIVGSEGEGGFGWPTVERVLNRYNSLQEVVYQDSDSSGIRETLDEENEYKFVTFKKSLEEVLDLNGFYVKLEWTGDHIPTLNKLKGTYEKIMVQSCVTSDERENIHLSNANEPVPVYFEAQFTNGEPSNYPGYSDLNTRYITFGRRPVPVKDIYVRIGIPKGSQFVLKSCEIEESHN